MKRLAIVIAVLILAAAVFGALAMDDSGGYSSPPERATATATVTPTPEPTIDMQNGPDIPPPCPWPDCFPVTPESGGDSAKAKGD